MTPIDRTPSKSEILLQLAIAAYMPNPQNAAAQLSLRKGFEAIISAVRKLESIPAADIDQFVRDPLSTEEMELVLAHMRKNLDVRAWAYFEMAFMTGMRPEELIELRWGDVDWAAETIRVQRARTAGEVKPLKTYNARDVDLVKRAITALEAMKPWTMVGSQDKTDQELGRRIFENPVTGRPWHDERSQRDTFWRPALRACGIRWRRAYQTRHTYATNALAAGSNPGYVARQMGHKNAKMLFTVYSKWIDGADRGREKAKLERMLAEMKNVRCQVP